MGCALVLASRDVISDEMWRPLFEGVKAMRRPPVDRRTIVEAMAWTGRQTLGRFSARQVLDPHTESFLRTEHRSRKDRHLEL